MSTPIRWGILGAGAVARGFAHGLRALPDAHLSAVSSRTAANARDFAKSFSIPKVYTRAEELARDPEIDLIYVATPHHRHMEDCLLCLEHGKAVLCEKPFSVSARQAREVITAARRRQVFCMEAMWMRFVPAMRKLRELVQSGAIGEVRMISADFGVANQFDPRSRLFDPQQAGGALLDLGVYPISLASMLLGAPEAIVAQATIGASSVDDQSSVLLRYPGGQLAVLSASLRAWSPQEAVIMGSRGRIKVHAPFYCARKLTITPSGENSSAHAGGARHRLVEQARNHPLLRTLYGGMKGAAMGLLGRGTRTISLSLTGNGYNYEAAEAMRCLRAGELESPLMPLDETLRIMETMDQVRAQWHLSYPGE